MIFTFVLSALHRYLLIVHNRSPTIFTRPCRVLLLLFVKWVLCILVSVFSVVPGAKLILYMYRDTCIVISHATPIMQLVFVIFTLAVPLLVVPLLYLHIYIVVRRSGNQANSGSANAKHHKTAKILFIIYITFLFTYLPYVGLNFNGPLKDIHRTRYADIGIWSLLFCSFALNPIMYCALFENMRKAYINFGLCGCKKTGAIAPDNGQT